MNARERDVASLADIHPDAFYTAGEVASVLRLSKETVYRLGRTPRLPKTGLGPNGGKTAFLGRAILDYARGRAA